MRKTKKIIVCPVCETKVVVKPGNCWYCPNCGTSACGIDEDMIVEIEIEDNGGD